MAFNLSEIFGRLLLILLAFSGYPAGQILANLAEEEVRDKAGKFWFRLLRNISLLSIAGVLLFYSFSHTLLLLPLVLILAFLALTLRKVQKQKEFIGYFLVLLSIILAISRDSKGLNLLIACLIFIYLTASVAVIRGEKK